MKNFYIIGFLLLINKAFAQEIEIGQKAEEIKRIIELGTRYQNNTAWDISYENGEIKDIILCYYDEILVEVGIEADFCKHFIIQNGKLDHILTQYGNISFAELKSYYQKLPNREIEGFYFSSDYRNFSELFMHPNGLASVKWSETIPSDFKSQTLINKLNQIFEDQDKARNEVEKKELELKGRKEAITSKIYDLKKLSEEDYNYALGRQIDLIIGFYFLKSKNLEYPALFPNLDEAKREEKKYIRIINKYNVYYESRKDRRLIKKIEHLSGKDYENKLFDVATLSSLPVSMVEEFYVRPSVNFKNLVVDYTSGITKVKIKNNKVSFEEFLPETDLQEAISEKLLRLENGWYLVTYKVAKVNTRSRVETTSKRIERKTKIDFASLKF